MNNLQELLEQSTVQNEHGYSEVDPTKLAELVVQQCVSTLDFHGHELAIPCIQWMAKNKLGIK